jgi:hypothetical protein
VGSGFEKRMDEIEIWAIVSVQSIQWEISQLPRDTISHIG